MLWVLLTFAIINTILLIAGLIQLRRIKEEMATKEDVQKLETALSNVQTAAELIGQDVAALKEELKTANENSNADLTNAIGMAEGIETRLKAIAGPNVGSDPEAPPVEEPPAEPPV